MRVLSVLLSKVASHRIHRNNGPSKSVERQKVQRRETDPIWSWNTFTPQLGTVSFENAQKQTRSNKSYTPIYPPNIHIDVTFSE